ncbi:hypothetical protein [Nocardia sp. NPDC003183]
MAFPLSDNAPFEPTSQIAKTTYRVRERTLTIETTTGDQIVAEIPIRDDLNPCGDRPSVYLDQNQWSALYKAHQVIGGIAPKEQRAAEWLIEQTENKRIILPISSGHMSETCQWRNGGERYALAVQMLRLSAGWQLRDPLAVRHDELAASMLGVIGNRDQPAFRPVVTLEPFATHAGRQEPNTPITNDLAEFGFELDTLISTASLFDTLLDTESISQNPGSGWVERNQRFTDWLGAQENRGRELVRKQTYAFFFADTYKEIATAAQAAGVSPELMGSWVLSHMETEVSKMPSLGLFREIFHDKLVDSRTSWNSNDLNDIFYLTCGMAYCDYAVGEKYLMSRARQSLQRLGRPFNIFRRLSDCVPVLADRIGERFDG